ncbi:MAG: hypothetical protein MR629_07595 [Helicobacter sp.]|nr:hypothetical protein [Helicobacter sp.]
MQKTIKIQTLFNEMCSFKLIVPFKIKKALGMPVKMRIFHTTKPRNRI